MSSPHFLWLIFVIFMGFLFRFLINCFDSLHICSLFSELFLFFSKPENFFQVCLFFSDPYFYYLQLVFRTISFLLQARKLFSSLFILFRSLFLLFSKKSISISCFTWTLSYRWEIKLSHTWLSSVWKNLTLVFNSLFSWMHHSWWTV